MTKKIIIANWKCNPVKIIDAEQLFSLVNKGLENIKKIEVVICPPFVYLSKFKLNKNGCKLGAQNCFWEEKGAYTGEISVLMLKKLGCKHIILGHSERRRILKETDEMINKKIKAVLKVGLIPILCVENISQAKSSLKGIAEKDFKKIILAFEPISAIGTSKPYPFEKARESYSSLRRVIGDSLIIYGGSVNSENANDYIDVGFDGLLIGGASLNSKEFFAIIQAVTKSKK